MIIEALQDNLGARAIRATQEGDVKTLRNLRKFAKERGDLPAQLVSTLSAVIGNALTLYYAGSSIRNTYSDTDAELWYSSVSALFVCPTYAQVSLIALAAEEANVDLSVKRADCVYQDTLADKPTVFALLQSCYS